MEKDDWVQKYIRVLEERGYYNHLLEHIDAEMVGHWEGEI